MAFQIVAPGLGEVLNDPGTNPADSPSAMTAGAVVAAAYQEHGARMHRWALAWTRDPELAADIAQEALVRLLREVQRGRSPDNVGAWLQRTVRNLVFSGARRAAVARRLAPRLLRLDHPDEPEAVSLRDERCREIKAALAAMASADQVMLLMAASGASGEEIAGRLGLTHGAARTRLSRAHPPPPRNRRAIREHYSATGIATGHRPNAPVTVMVSGGDRRPGPRWRSLHHPPCRNPVPGVPSRRNWVLEGRPERW